MEDRRQLINERDGDPQDDRSLVACVFDGDAGAVADFFVRVKDVLWTVCRMGTRDEEAARQAYAIVRGNLQADGFARLRPFRCGRLTNFVAIAAREILIDHILNLPSGAADRRWLTFEALFKPHILAVVARLYPDLNRRGAAATGAVELTAKQADIYQRVSIRLAKDDYQLLRKYVAEGILGCSLKRMVINAAIDQHREEGGRPTLPARVEKLSPLDKLVFKAVYWEQGPENADALLSILAARTQPGLTREEIEASLLRVRTAVGPTYVRRREVPLPAGNDEGYDVGVHTPCLRGEDEAIKRHDEVLREGAIQALVTAVEGLPDRERIFVRTLLEGSNSERRYLFGEDNYKLKKRVKAKLLRELARVPAIQNWRENIAN